MAEINQSDRANFRQPEGKPISESMDERMRGIRKRAEVARDLDRDLREKGIDDFRFAWVYGNQWNDDLRMRRGRRPMYEFNKLGQAIKQVINNNRQNTPSIKVRANKESTRDIADIRQGLMRNIESMSHADSVYDWGSMFAITSGFGAWEITAEYTDDESFDQDLYIRQISNPLTSVFFGPSKMPDRRDAPYCFVFEDYTWDAFSERWPDAAYSSFDPISMRGYSDWCSEKIVRVAKYWYKETVEEVIYQLDNGDVVTADNYKETYGKKLPKSSKNAPDADEMGIDEKQDFSQKQAPEQPSAPQEDSYGNPIVDMSSVVSQLQASPTPPPPKILRQRTVSKERVKCEYVSGMEVLDGPYDWAGKFIPVVPVWGNLVNDEGRDEWFGMVRWSRDPQVLYNYNRSNSVEIMANQSRAPFMYTPKMIEGYETQWQRMAVDNPAGLPYNVDQGLKPERQPPPQFPAGLLEAANVDDADIKATTGIFQASLGQPSNETSGKAIQARSHQGNVATFDYQDNIAKAVQFTGEILDDLIPYYYDTFRELRILGPDGAEKYVEVNKPVYNAKTRQWETLNDLTTGRYDITVTAGPSYATQRMETLDAMLQMAQAGGPTAMLFQYAAIKNMDVPGMQEVEQAMRRMLVGMNILEPDENDPPKQQPQPNPKDIAEAQAAQAAAIKDQAQAGKYQAETQRTQVETQQMASMGPLEQHKVAAEAENTQNQTILDSNAAWQQAYIQAHRQQFAPGSLASIDQQSIPYGQQ